MSEWLLLQNNFTVCLVLFVLLLCGAIGFPPEDFTLILGGVVLNHGKSNFQTIFVLCYIGTVLGDFFIFAIGRWFGKALFQKEWFKKRVRPGRIRIIRSQLEKRSFPMIFIARHLFYLRTITFLTCGAVKLSFVRFLISDCLSALVSVPIMLLIGYQASEHYEKVMRYLGHAKMFSLVVAIGIVGAIAFMIRRHYKRLEKEGDAEKELGVE